MDRVPADKRILFEPAMLLCLFYLPLMIQQSPTTDFSAFNNPDFHILYYIKILPQIVLTLYLMKYSSVNIELIPNPASWSDFYGLRKPALSIFFIIPALTIGLWIINIIGSFVSRFIVNPDLDIIPRWEVNSISAMIMFFFTSQVTGWSEEMFFRGFLLRRILVLSENPLGPIIFTSLIFAAGHLYQGAAGFIVTFGIGLALSYYYYKRNDLAAISIAHGLYNFSIMLIAYIAK